ncbi:MAG: hypothetical protein QOJ03_11 [Frankiaceae bacterium]|nr:hypothetical protein [Frankiaceae bacterium]
MSRRRLVIGGVVVAAVLGAVVPSFAQSFAQSSAQQLPVTVHTDTHNGVATGVDINGRPGVGAAVTPDGTACVGVSLQVPFCTPPVIDTVNQSVSVSQLPVTVHSDTSNGVSVGVDVFGQPGAGAGVSPDGKVCAGVSEQLPVCVGGGGIRAASAQQPPLPPVVVRHDDNGSAVGVGDVGVVIRSDGSICPVVSTQDWMCLPGN